jgi:hypothetical protein
MVSHHVVYQLVLFALLWLFIILHLWPKPGVPILGNGSLSGNPNLPLPRIQGRKASPSPLKHLDHASTYTYHPLLIPCVPKCRCPECDANSSSMVKTDRIFLFK